MRHDDSVGKLSHYKLDHVGPFHGCWRWLLRGEVT